MKSSVNTNNNLINRSILHVDLDAFYASVEEKYHPEYIGKPVAVGGKSKHGIISTCNYEARKYGLHSAMPIFQATKLCPNLILIPVDMDLYIKESRKVFDILKSYTRHIEPVSVDEAYLDITKRPESGLFIANCIQEEVEDICSLSISVGISYNKFLAKLASDWKKPHGIFEIKPSDIPNILKPLQINKIHGLGKKGASKLNSFGIKTIGDVLKLNKNELFSLLGKQGTDIYDYIRGIDSRDVITSSERKSIGIERTLQQSIVSRNDVCKLIENYSDRLSVTMNEKNLRGKTVQLKLKTSSFKTITRSHSLDHYISTYNEINETAQFIFKSIELNEPIRLLGISCSNLIKSDLKQLDFL